MHDSLAQPGTQVSVVTIGAEDLETSVEFYGGAIGLAVRDRGTLRGSEFEHYWRLPAATTGRYAFLEHGRDPIGCVLLIEFEGERRPTGRPRQSWYPPYARI